MAWTWKGFWGDDPVYRFNCGQDFFQAGRSKAEERFWVNYIHDDGSFLRPLRSRMTSRASSVVTSASGRPRTRNISTQSDSSWSSGTVSGRTRNSSSGSISDQVIITSVTSAVNEKKSDSSTNISEDENNEADDEVNNDVKNDEKMSTVTCQSCSRCNQPLTRGVERERFISRMV